MPGFEVFGEEERNEVNEVLNTGILMRYGFDQARAGKKRSMHKYSRKYTKRFDLS